MQTLERPTEQPGRPPRPRLDAGLAVLAAIIGVPLVVLLVMSKWGVVVALVLAFVAALGIWALRRGFLFIEIVAFLIHFDGLGAGPIRIGRIMAAVAFVVIGYKLVVERWRPPAIPMRHWLPVLLLVIYATMTGLWSEAAGGWFYSMGLIALAIAYFGVSGLLVDSGENMMRYLRAYWWGGLWGSAAGVLALFLGTRSEGLAGDPNFFGIIAASMIPLTVYYRRNEPDARRRLYYTAALIFVLAGAAGAGSRSGLIGASVAIVATLVTRPGLSAGRRVRVSFVAVILAGLAFLIGFVANPNNVSRGFADRGAGRLDFWNVTIELIHERPLFGFGFGQLKLQIIPHLPTTEGVQRLSDSREEVSSHNTWLDVTGDLGATGLILWISIFVVTLLGLIRPRWNQTREISTTLVVMMLPVLVGSMFLPLLNNKLCWSLIGLAAALQVPSWGTRWRGFAATSQHALPPAGPGAGLAAGASTDVGVDPAQVTVPDPTVPASALAAPEWSEPVLARWDVRVSRRFRFSLLAGLLIGALSMGALFSALPPQYTASGNVLVPALQKTRGADSIAFSPVSQQIVHTLAISNAYAVELKRLSGIDLSVEDIRDRVDVVRDGFSAFMSIQFTDNDRAIVEQAQPYVLEALDAVVAKTRSFADEELRNEFRPQFPGEQRYDNTSLYLHMGDETFFETQPPRVAWGMFIGALTGLLVAVGFVLLQQREPRVNNDDDFPSAIGLWVWTHVGRAGRRYAATEDQYAQVVTSAEQLVPPGELPRHLVISTPRPDRAARGLAMGVAGALAAEGRRVVLVDAQLDHRLLSLRLGGRFRSGLVQAVDGEVPIDSVVRRVNRWRLPTSVRRFLRGRGDVLRFVPAGRVRRGRIVDVRPGVLDRFGPDVTVVVLAPSLMSEVPAGAILNWADAVVLALVEGRTVTFDAEDAAAQVRTFVGSPAGVVLLDV